MSNIYYKQFPNSHELRSKSLTADKIWVKNGEGEFQEVKPGGGGEGEVNLPDYTKENKIDFADYLDGKTIIDKNKINTESISLQEDTARRVQIGGTLPSGSDNTGKITISDGLNQIKHDTVGIQVIPENDPQYTLLYDGIKDTVQKLENIDVVQEKLKYLNAANISIKDGATTKAYLANNRLTVGHSSGKHIDLEPESTASSRMLIRNDVNNYAFYYNDKISYRDGATTSTSIRFDDILNTINTVKNLPDPNSKQDKRDYLADNNTINFGANGTMSANNLTHKEILVNDGATYPRTRLTPGLVTISNTNANGNFVHLRPTNLSFDAKIATYANIIAKANEMPMPSYLNSTSITMRDSENAITSVMNDSFLRNSTKIFAGVSDTGKRVELNPDKIILQTLYASNRAEIDHKEIRFGANLNKTIAYQDILDKINEPTADNLPEYLDDNAIIFTGKTKNGGYFSTYWHDGVMSTHGNSYFRMMEMKGTTPKPVLLLNRDKISFRNTYEDEERTIRFDEIHDSIRKNLSYEMMKSSNSRMIPLNYTSNVGFHPQTPADLPNMMLIKKQSVTDCLAMSLAFTKNSGYTILDSSNPNRRPFGILIEPRYILDVIEDDYLLEMPQFTIDWKPATFIEHQISRPSVKLEYGTTMYTDTSLNTYHILTLNFTTDAVATDLRGELLLKFHGYAAGDGAVNNTGNKYVSRHA